MIRNRWLKIGMACFILFFSFGSIASVEGHEEQEDGTWFSLVDEEGNLLMQTANTVYTGDLYINANNLRYIVEEIEGRTALCRYDGIEEMPTLNPATQQADLLAAIADQGTNDLPTIAIYHTHDDESYVPSDGTESIRGDGGIYDVGEELKSELESMGFQVLYSEAKHDPHDVNAYNRSRETAASLLRDGSDVLIDVHRDAVPPENYATEIDGEAATKIKLVVGKSNPNQTSNMEFAKTLKAAMDEKEPGLSAGIYEGKGDYNQDLTPRAILIEVGAHTNSKEEAKNGVVAFAQSLPLALGVQAENETSNQESNPIENQESEATNSDTEENTQAKPLEEAESNGKFIWIGLIVVIGLVGVYYFVTRSRS